MAALVWSQIIKEPVVREGDPASNDPGLQLNLDIHGEGAKSCKANQNQQ